MSSFTNQAVDPEQLPHFRQLTLQPVATCFPAYCMVRATLFWLPLLLLSLLSPFLPFIDQQFGFWPAAAVAVLGCYALLIRWLDAHSRGWALREHDLVYRYGIIWRRTVIMPFARIQHVESSNGPLERQFGLVRLKCFTAGGARSDLAVTGLLEEDGHRVRQYLLEQIRDDVTAAGEPEALDAAG